VLYLLLMLPACLAPFLFPVVGVLAAALGALAYLIVLYVALTAVQSIFVVELYRFATRGHADGGFGPDELQNAFS
jgi:cobalamin synthase